jgi:hypothetical protein
VNSLPPIDPYVETYFWLSSAWKEGIPSEWVRRGEVERWLTEQIMASLEPFGSEVSRPYPTLASNIFDRLVEQGLLAIEKNPVSGTYYHIDADNLKNFKGRYLNESDLNRQNSIIGPKLFHDIFHAYGDNELPQDSIQWVPGASIPASDRVVTLNHNQIDELSEPLLELIVQVEKTNGDPDHPGFRERIIGQLKQDESCCDLGCFGPISCTASF